MTRYKLIICQVVGVLHIHCGKSSLELIPRIKIEASLCSGIIHIFLNHSVLVRWMDIAIFLVKNFWCLGSLKFIPNPLWKCLCLTYVKTSFWHINLPTQIRLLGSDCFRPNQTLRLLFHRAIEAKRFYIEKSIGQDIWKEQFFCLISWFSLTWINNSPLICKHFIFL